MVNIPSFMVRTDSEKAIDTAYTSPFGQGRKGRTSRKQTKRRAANEAKANVETARVAKD
jgi:small subunit ribosomal protein S9e